MYCPSCGNEITVELKYCNRCGANLTQGLISQNVTLPPVKLAAPTAILGFTVLAAIGIIIGGAVQFAVMGIHPAAIVWIILFCMATLFGCVSLIVRFWSKVISMNREPQQIETRPQRPQVIAPALTPPRLEAIPSVTEHTTRTFPRQGYREESDR